MNRLLTVAIITSVLKLAPVQAAAETFLISAPVPGGAGGLVCACTNLTKKTLLIDFILQQQSGGSACSDQLSLSGSLADCQRLYTSTTICKVRRSDGKRINKKQLSCTLSALDGSGNPIAVVPVNQKLNNSN